MTSRLYRGSTERDRLAVEQLQVENERREAHRERSAPSGTPYNEACWERDQLWREIVDLMSLRREYAEYELISNAIKETLKGMLAEHEALAAKCKELGDAERVTF